MKPVEIDGERSNVIEMQHQKARNFEAAKPFFLERRPDLSMVRTDDPKKRGKNGSQAQAVVEALQELGGKVGKKSDLWLHLQTSTGKPETSVRRMVKTALDLGVIVECRGEGKSGGAGGLALMGMERCQGATRCQDTLAPH